MKSFLLSFAAAVFVALALVAAGVSLDLGEYIALTFSALLLGWFLSSYSRKFPQLTTDRPMRPTLPENPPSRRPTRKAA